MKLAERVSGVMDKVIAFRRELHQHPELSMQEFGATKRIMELLADVPNLEVKDLNPGVVAVLRGKKPGKAVALRADIDALPIKEDSGLPFASVNDGVCHACGHDLHAASLLGCALVLAPLADSISGSITFIFQPGEETLSGAVHMLAHNVLDNPKVEAIFGMHTAPWVPVGSVNVSPGVIMASTDSFEIEVHGSACHGAYPHRGVDAVVAAAHVVTAVQTLASRWCDPLDSLVVSMGVIKGGMARNIIADKVSLSGTIRTLSADVRSKVPAQLTQVVSHTAQAFGATATVSIEGGTSLVNNDAELTRQAIGSATKALGADKVFPQAKPVMGAEDFSLFMEKVPGVFIRVGTFSEDDPQTGFPGHNAKIRYDEGALNVGVSVFCHMALDFLDCGE